MRWAAARMWETRGVYRILVQKPVGKRSLGRTRHRWEEGSLGNGIGGME